MKQKLQNIFFLFLLGAIGVKAQGPVITATGFNPQIGDSIKTIRTTASSAWAVDSGGANRVWDYSALKDTETVQTSYYVSPNLVPRETFFPNANIAILPSYQGVQGDFGVFYHVSDSSWVQLSGLGDSNDTSLNDHFSGFPVMNYPMSYNKTFYNVYQDTAYYTNGGLYTNSYDTLVGDGYGTLILPNATYYNVVRVYRKEFGAYYFITNGIHSPLLTLGCYSQPASPNAPWAGSYYLGNGDALPIQVSSFTASWQNNLPYLQWEVANTQNTKQFNIQRSVDGHSFETVGQVGISSGSAYHFEDNYKPSSTVYYRLQQVDKTGQSFYSNTTQLSVNGKQFTVYPNPAKDNVVVNGSHIASVKVLDNMGKEIKIVSLNDATNPQLSLSNLPAGAYHLQIQTTDGKVNVVGVVKE